MSKVIGIDLGTTKSCVAVMEGGQPTVIANSEGSRATPSVVAFTKNGERLVGEKAKNLALINPDQSVFSAVHDIGTANKVLINGKKYFPEHICSIILRKMRETAESYIGEKVSQAVVSVPACFDFTQRQAIVDAGRIAGLNILRIISEPMAAAMSSGLGMENNRKILVYALGGGHADVSILNIGDGVYELMSTSSNPGLGGDDFDRRIVDYIADQFKNETGIDLRRDKTAAQRLKIAAENAKIELSQSSNAYINLPFITTNPTGPKHLNTSLARAVFNKLTADLVDETIALISKALKDAALTIHQISNVFLVGGCTQIPAVWEAVKKATGREPFKGLNRDECIAIGAAIEGGILNGEVKDILPLDVASVSLGVETEGHVFTKLIDRNCARRKRDPAGTVLLWSAQWTWRTVPNGPLRCHPERSRGIPY